MVTITPTNATGKAHLMKSSKERPLFMAIRIPIGFPRTVPLLPTFVAKMQPINNGVGSISKWSHNSMTIADIKMIDVTSSMAMARNIDVRLNVKTSRAVRNPVALTILIISQRNIPTSLNISTITIIPIRKKITSIEANSIVSSTSMVFVINKNAMPKKAMPTRKPQNIRVPNTAAIKIDDDST